MRAALLIPVLVLGLAGCGVGKTGTGADYFDDMACDAEPWDWFADPVTYLMEADEDGEWDFDPPHDYVTGIEGRYDYEEGDIEWGLSFLDAYTTDSYDVEGYGTVFEDGDVDLLFKTVTEDVLGSVAASRSRLERDGCDATLKLWTIDADADVDATPSEDAFVWTYDFESDDQVSATTTDAGWSYVRTWRADLTITTTGEGSGVSYETVSYGDGTSESWQESSDSDFDSRIEQSRALDGTADVLSQVWYAGTDTLYQQCEYQVTYAGDGDGSCVFNTEQGELECDLDFDPSSCVLDCGSAGTFDC